MPNDVKQDPNPFYIVSSLAALAGLLVLLDILGLAGPMLLLAIAGIGALAWLTIKTYRWLAIRPAVRRCLANGIFVAAIGGGLWVMVPILMPFLFWAVFFGVMMATVCFILLLAHEIMSWVLG